jgi:hypothetical protein
MVTGAQMESPSALVNHIRNLADASGLLVSWATE